MSWERVLPGPTVWGARVHSRDWTRTRTTTLPRASSPATATSWYRPRRGMTRNHREPVTGSRLMESWYVRMYRGRNRESPSHRRNRWTLDMSLLIGHWLCSTTIIISPFNRTLYSSLIDFDFHERLFAVKKISCLSTDQWRSAETRDDLLSRV